jgi:hypothetical protein
MTLIIDEHIALAVHQDKAWMSRLLADLLPAHLHGRFGGNEGKPDLANIPRAVMIYDGSISTVKLNSNTAHQPVYIVEVLLSIFHDRAHPQPRHDNTWYWVVRKRVLVKANKWHDVWMLQVGPAEYLSSQHLLSVAISLRFFRRTIVLTFFKAFTASEVQYRRRLMATVVVPRDPL